jgi:pimeloyl-ACP methyl ester carboxylesterase/predicted glycosyltransferase
MAGERGIARHPDESGVVRREGVSIAYDVFGEGSPTVLLLPTWSLVHSRVWKAQVPYLSRHYRVVTFDGRGNGRSDRPAGPDAYADEEFVSDALAVMDATGTGEAVLVALSMGNRWAVHLAAEHGDRVTGLFGIAPSCGLVRSAGRERYAWDEVYDEHPGWAKYNRHYWREGDFQDFREFFFGELFNEPHSTKPIEDGMWWSSTITGEILADTNDGKLDSAAALGEGFEQLCREVSCPVHIVHGRADRIRPHEEGERLAELTGGSFTLLEGAGHGPMGRDPVKVNRLIREFVDRVSAPPPARRTWTRAHDRPERALYISSPIGLGHARRDLAVVQELRRHRPGLEVDWLAQHPVTRVLEANGERVHPASAWLANESGHIEDEAHEHDLHAFQAIRRMDEILVNNFMVFEEVVRDRHYDLVVGDEAWDVDYFLHENPELKRFAYAWMTDFVGWLPMPSGGAAEARLTTDYNAEMIEQRARYRRLRDRSVFVGSPEDVVPMSFGDGLPEIRQWTMENFDFAGYVTGFTPPDEADRALLRSRLGYGDDDLLCVVTVGGSGVGRSLLGRVLDAVPLARRIRPELRFLVVTGPRIDPGSLPRRRGVAFRAYLPDLHRYLAACDLAVVQGGLTTCMELTATGRPFLYVPLENHFEQNFHVRHRLDRYDAGRCLSYDDARDPDWLAEAIVKEVGREVNYRAVETDGAARAAAMLADLL